MKPSAFFKLVLIVLASIMVCNSPTLASASPCPHLARARQAGNLEGVGSISRKLMASGSSPAPKPSVKSVDTSYISMTAAYRNSSSQMFDRLAEAIKDCQISKEQMAYNNNSVPTIEGDAVFFPAASWVRALFHEAGTFVAKLQDGGPKGGLNGSLGTKCLNATCDNPLVATLNTTTTCSNGLDPVGGFDVYNTTNSAGGVVESAAGLFFCCPANMCIAKTNAIINGVNDGAAMPTCMDGSSIDNELCRRENDGLLPTIRFYRARQVEIQGRPGGVLVSLADTIVLAASAVAKKCSADALVVPSTIGRGDAVEADDVLPPLPSPNDVLARHTQIFKAMGLDKKDMATLLVGSHSIGGYRKSNSGGVTSCPFVPFDCTPASQFGPAPFDNNVFKVACDGVMGVTMGNCSWSSKCTDPTIDEPGCPFGASVTAKYPGCFVQTSATNQTVYPTTFPAAGLVSDKALCQDPNTMLTMVNFANSQSNFFSAYKDSFVRMSALGYDRSLLTSLI